MESFVIDQEFEEDPQVEAAKFLLSPEEDRSVDPETQARLEALLQAAGKYEFLYYVLLLGVLYGSPSLVPKTVIIKMNNKEDCFSLKAFLLEYCN